MEKSSGSTENSSEMQIIETCKKPQKKFIDFSNFSSGDSTVFG